jgi:hypothetical protein
MKSSILFALFVLACASGPNPPPSRKLPDGSNATCESACARLRKLACETSAPTEDGSTCEDVCRNSLATPYSRIDVACMTRAPSCAASEKC